MPYKDKTSPAAKASQRRAEAKYYDSHKKEKAAHHRAWRAENPEHGNWKNMMIRCFGVNGKDYPRYGGANPPVTVCKLWQTYEGFIGSIGPRPSPQHSLSRFGDIGNYEPGNCIWGDRKHQAEQKRIKRMAAAA